MSLFRRQEHQERGSRDGESSYDPHTWTIPMQDKTWSMNASAPKHPPTAIPYPSVFKDAITPMSTRPGVDSFSLTQYPSPGHIAAHLCMMECFASLKEKVETLPSFRFLDPPSYAASSSPSSSSCPPEGPDQPKAAGPSERWKVLVRVAVSRFRVWFSNIENTLRHASAYNRTGVEFGGKVSLTKDYLPPLDVLLVWHSYMYDPMSYHSDIISNDAKQLLGICLPWEALLQVIDRDSLTYNLPNTAQKLFTTLTEQEPDILRYLQSPPAYTVQEEEWIYSTDLVAAVHAQQNFIDTMHRYLWLRSPSLEGTLERALVQYHALASSPSNSTSVEIWTDTITADPSLELTWRTHLLFPVAYRCFCKDAFGQGVFPAPSNSTSLSRYSKSQTEETLVEQCYCWICERIRDENPGYTRAAEEHRLDDNIVTQDPLSPPITKRLSWMQSSTRPGTIPSSSPSLFSRHMDKRKSPSSGLASRLQQRLSLSRSTNQDDDGHENLNERETQAVLSSPPLPSSTTFTTKTTDTDNTITPPAQNLEHSLSPSQISAIKSDVAFHRLIHSLLTSHYSQIPSSSFKTLTAPVLPTRPPTSPSQLAELRHEAESKDRAGRYWGNGYIVETVQPAVYDLITGKLMRPEKRKLVKRDANVGPKLLRGLGYF